MEGFLDLKIPIWARVLFTRLVAIGPGILVAIFTQGKRAPDCQLTRSLTPSYTLLHDVCKPHPTSCSRLQDANRFLCCIRFFCLLKTVPALYALSMCVTGDQQLSDAFQEWINILQSIQLTFALLPVLHFTSSKKIMGTAAGTLSVRHQMSPQPWRRNAHYYHL